MARSFENLTAVVEIDLFRTPAIRRLAALTGARRSLCARHGRSFYGRDGNAPQQCPAGLRPAAVKLRQQHPRFIIENARVCRSTASHRSSRIRRRRAAPEALRLVSRHWPPFALSRHVRRQIVPRRQRLQGLEAGRRITWRDMLVIGMGALGEQQRDV
jgi:hypothetical protein